MAFIDLEALLEKKGLYPKGTTERFKHMDALERVLNGSIFDDALDVPFDQEETSGRTYIPLKQRRPALFYNMAKVITDHTTSLTFGESHAPAVRLSIEDDDSEELSKRHETLEQLIETIELDAIMAEAMHVGSVGSVAIILQVLPNKRPWFEIVDGKFCTPFFDPRDPTTLQRLERVFFCTQSELEAAGYDIEETDDKGELKYKPGKRYWIRILYTETDEIRSFPMVEERYELLGEDDPDDVTKKVKWIVDEERSYKNDFNFMNVLWIRNLDHRRNVDGKCTFAPIIDHMIEISYLQSQIGRGYRYAADPMIVISRGELNALNPLGGFSDGATAQSTPIQKSPARAIEINGDGKASMLEITGNGLKNAGEHVRMLREYAFEIISGMKADQQHAGGVHSGRALEYLHKALIWLVERFRVSYGTRGYLPLLKMVIQGVKDGTLAFPRVEDVHLDVDDSMRLVWPQWETPTGQDLLATLQALQIAAGGSPQTPVPLVPREYVSQKSAAAIGVSDGNRAAAQLIHDHGDLPLPLELQQQQVEIQDKTADAAVESAKNKGSDSPKGTAAK